MVYQDVPREGCPRAAARWPCSPTQPANGPGGSTPTHGTDSCSSGMPASFAWRAGGAQGGSAINPRVDLMSHVSQADGRVGSTWGYAAVRSAMESSHPSRRSPSPPRPPASRGITARHTADIKTDDQLGRDAGPAASGAVMDQLPCKGPRRRIPLRMLLLVHGGGNGNSQTQHTPRTELGDIADL
jgi:hypothetical protein